MEQGLQVASRRAATTPAIARVVSQAIADRRLLRLEYYKANEDEFSERDGRALRADQRPRGLVRRLVRPGARTTSATSAWTASRPPRSLDDDVRAARPRSIRPPTSRAGRAPARSRPRAIARVWISPERARWAREERRVAEELTDGSVIVELPFKGTDWLVREVLQEAGDAAVLEPADAREAVRRGGSTNSAER